MGRNIQALSCGSKIKYPSAPKYILQHPQKQLYSKQTNEVRRMICIDSTTCGFVFD